MSYTISLTREPNKVEEVLAKHVPNDKQFMSILNNKFLTINFTRKRDVLPLVILSIFIKINHDIS